MLRPGRAFVAAVRGMRFQCSYPTPWKKNPLREMTKAPQSLRSS